MSFLINTMDQDDNILIFCAHSDDQVLGVGGTIAKYAAKGKKIRTVIFSYGEMSHFWIKPKYSIEIRVKEAAEADKILGGSGVSFLGLNEGKFVEEFKEKQMDHVINNLLIKYKPKRIFTHSPDEFHSDHKNVFKLVKSVLDKKNYKGEIFCFEVWNNFIRFGKKEYPKLYIDIADTFKTKIKALEVFKSQRLALLMLTWSVYLKAIIDGFNIDSRYAEKYRLIK